LVSGTIHIAHLDIPAFGPDIDEPSSPSQDSVLDYLLFFEVPDCSPLTQAASPDRWDRTIPSPSCSPDTFLSLVFDEEPTTPSPTCSPNVFFGLGYSPSCSPDISAAPPDDSYLLPENSHCLLDNFYCLTEKPGLDVEKDFVDLGSGLPF